MTPAVASPVLSVTTTPPSTLETELCVLPCFDGDSISGALKEAVRTLAELAFTGVDWK